MIDLRSVRWLPAMMIAFMAAGAMPSSAQVPPRFYWKSLVGGRAVPVIGMSMSGNANPVDPAYTVSPEASFEATVALAGYAHTFTLFDRSAMAAMLVPMGRLSGGAVDLRPNVRRRSEWLRRSASTKIEIDINLIGPEPIRNIPDLVRYEPGFSLDVLADLVIPIGEYDSEESLNLGQNRWYGRVGAPIVWQLGPWVPGRIGGTAAWAHPSCGSSGRGSLAAAPRSSECASGMTRGNMMANEPQDEPVAKDMMASNSLRVQRRPLYAVPVFVLAA